MALAALPAVGGSLAILYQDVLARRRLNVTQVLSIALDGFAGSSEEFIDRFRDDERLQMVFARAMEAASRTSLGQKIRALGPLLGEASDAASDGELDDVELLLWALEDLERPHVAALQELGRYRSDDELAADTENIGDDPSRLERLEYTRSVAEPVIATLLRHGLVAQQSGYDLYLAGVTPFGRKLLTFLHREAANQD